MMAPGLIAARMTAPLSTRLLRNEDSVGVLGYSFLEQNLDRIKAASVGDVPPTFENIISGEYGVSRSMYFYVKREHLPLVPGLAEFVEEFTQEDAWGPDGYLADKGLIPLHAGRAARCATRTRLRRLQIRKVHHRQRMPRRRHKAAETLPG